MSEEGSNIQSDGNQAEWGKVLAWEPPYRLAFTLHPGLPPETAGDVEVTFWQEANGTRVSLIHSGWERCGEAALTMRAGYARGWEYILGRFQAETVIQP